MKVRQFGDAAAANDEVAQLVDFLSTDPLTLVDQLQAQAQANAADSTVAPTSYNSAGYYPAVSVTAPRKGSTAAAASNMPAKAVGVAGIPLVAVLFGGALVALALLER